MTELELSFHHIKYFPQLVPQLAQWFHDEWGHFNPAHTLTMRCQELLERQDPNELPLTMVALLGGELVGTYSLDLDDLRIRPELSPWLASVYVHPSYRKKGIGTALVHHAIKQARSLRLDTFYLFTADQAAWYRSMGWHTIEEIPYSGITITIMRFDF